MGIYHKDIWKSEGGKDGSVVANYSVSFFSLSYHYANIFMENGTTINKQ